MAPTSRTEINYDRLWELSNHAGLHHSQTSEIAGMIYSIQNADGSSSTDGRTSEQKDTELAGNRASVIAWAKKHFPDMLNEAPEKLCDPISYHLFTDPQTHKCGTTEHTIEPESLIKEQRRFNQEKFVQDIKKLPQYLLIESVILKYFTRVDFYLSPLHRVYQPYSPYAYNDLLQPAGQSQEGYTRWDAKYGLQRDLRDDPQLSQANREFKAIVIQMTTTDFNRYVIEGGRCPYTRTQVTSTRNAQLQEEVYHFVLIRMGVLNTPQPARPSTDSSSSSDPCVTPAIMTTRVSVNPTITLQKIGGLVNGLIDKLSPIGSYYNPHPIEHADPMADGCYTCADGAKKLLPAAVQKDYEDIQKAIASLPGEVQSTLHFKTWERRGDADTNKDPDWGKNHLLSNLHRTLSVVREALREQMTKRK